MMRERLIPVAAATSALLVLAACSSDGGDAGRLDGSTTAPRETSSAPATAPGGTGSDTTVPGNRNRPQAFGARLEFFGDCPALLEYMQTEAAERVTPWGLGGGPVFYDGEDGALDMAEEAVPEAAGDAATGTSGGEPRFSETNTQEIGVDEGDIVETDGRHVYVATSDGVRIVSVADAIVVAEPELPEGTHQMLLESGRLLVVTSSWSGTADTIVSLFDVSDPASPSLLRRSHLEGAVVATRSIDGVARLVVSTSFDQRLPFVQPDQFGFDEESALARNRQIIAESSVEDWLPRWFDEAGDGSFGEIRQLLPCEDVAAPPDFAGLGLTWIASVDTLGDATPVGSAGVVSTGDTVYASTDNLYIATQNWDWRWGGPVPMPVDVAPEPAIDPAADAVTDGPTTDETDAAAAPEPAAPPTSEPAIAVSGTTDVATTVPDPTTTVPDPTTTVPDTTTTVPDPTTTVPDTTTTVPDTTAPTTTVPDPEIRPGPPPTLIHQFALGDGTDATYVASGAVEGRLLNQFAMSEHDGDLRVATTTEDWGFGEQQDSTVYVLRPDGGELREIASIGGLGRGEQIYAVRFMGDVAYVVTFRQIDPLYVLDLSDPAAPVLEGELKIPGYSAYLHPVGEGLLLGVGQDATEQGRTTGTQLSLFDVSDPTNPERISTLPVGGRSEVEWDHKAFLYWEPDGTIVLPVSPGWGDCGPGLGPDDCLAKDIAGAGGAVVAELNGRELAARGVINHAATGRSGCWNPLQRSIVIDDELVTVGLDQLQFSDRETLERRATVSWGDPEQYGCAWYWEG